MTCLLVYLLCVCLTASAAETGDGAVTSHRVTSLGVTSHGVDGVECGRWRCLNGGVCVAGDQQQQTCKYVAPASGNSFFQFRLVSHVM